jgi:hypothetical protein
MGDNFEGDLESISAVNTTESVNESQFFDLKKNVPPFLEILLGISTFLHKVPSIHGDRIHPRRISAVQTIQKIQRERNA